MTHDLRGSLPPIVTPFRNGEVDYDTYAELIEFQIERGYAWHRRQCEHHRRADVR